MQETPTHRLYVCKYVLGMAVKTVSQKMGSHCKLFPMKPFPLIKKEWGQVSNTDSKPPASYGQI